MDQQSRGSCSKNRFRAISSRVSKPEMFQQSCRTQTSLAPRRSLTEENQATRIAEVADLIKSEYFRLSDAETEVLSRRFDEQHLDLLRADVPALTPETIARLKNRHRIGFWDADALENAFAYVGSELPVTNG